MVFQGRNHVRVRDMRLAVSLREALLHVCVLSVISVNLTDGTRRRHTWPFSNVENILLQTFEPSVAHPFELSHRDLRGIKVGEKVIEIRLVISAASGSVYLLDGLTGRE